VGASANQGLEKGGLVLLGGRGAAAPGGEQGRNGSKPSFSIALICTTRRQIPVGASTNQES